MFEIIGSKGKATVMTDMGIDDTTTKQLYEICNSPLAEDANIVIMPDAHKGEGSCIGFTSTLGKYISPDIIGVDQGCGVSSYKLEFPVKINIEALEKFIRSSVPTGFCRRDKSLKKATPDIERIVAETGQDLNDVMCSLGTLGSNNHFIEIGTNNDDVWLTIHTGSRNFGYRLASYYTHLANKSYIEVGSELFKNYIRDMNVAVKYAELNRLLISQQIFKFFNRLAVTDTIHSIHNYIGMDGIIRKGAISAYSHELVTIPLNRKDGVIIGRGIGNDKWNYSAPHGAGRTMSRSSAKKTITLEEYETAMKGVYTTDICQATLDEAPMAYKEPKYILSNLNETVQVLFVLKTICSIKAK